MAKKKQTIKLRPGIDIGALAAEHDKEYRSSCFVEVPAIEQITGERNNRSILLARTGAGKSAILLRLEETHENVSRIDPKEASFEFVSGSTIIQNLVAIGVDLHVFYEYLWKHVLCIHIITECLGVRSNSKLQSFFRMVETLILRDSRNQIVYEYLVKWKGRFWISADEVSREIISEISTQLAASLGLSAGSLETELEAAAAASKKEKRRFKNRAQQIVSTLQIQELNQTISALSELIAARKCTYYVLIDDLDQHWVSEQLQYPLIRSLIDSLQTFGRIPQVRIVVALREDLFDAVITSTAERHFQSEKLEGLIVRLHWSDDQLRHLLETRIRHLFKNAYTTTGVRMNDVFPESIRDVQLYEYLISRSLRRPRDVIDFVNKILEKNVSATLPLSQRQITASEPEYSRSRIRGLCDEWRSLHPMLKIYLDVLAARPQEIPLSHFDEDALLDVAVEAESLQREPADEVERIAARAYDRDKEQHFSKLTRELICCLYKVGAVGVKFGKGERYRHSFTDEPNLIASQLGPDSKIAIVPMLSCALSTRGRVRIAA